MGFFTELSGKKQLGLKLAYFGQVFAEFSGLPRDTQRGILEVLPLAVKLLADEFAKTGTLKGKAYGGLTWADLAVFEDAVLTNQDLPTLRRKVWHMRSRFNSLVGQDLYHAYLDSQPPDPQLDATTDTMLRADARRLLALTHWFYGLTSIRERMRTDIGWWAGGAVLAVLAAALAVNWRRVSDWWTLNDKAVTDLVGLITLVIVFGVVGAFVSFSRRLDANIDGSDPVIGSMRLMIFKTGAPFNLLLGGIFSVILYVILLGKFLSGSLFPDLTHGALPGDVENWAKLLVWSFLAGFAERLVPDTLDRLVGQANVSIAAIGQAPQAPAGGAAAPGGPGKAPDEGGGDGKPRNQQPELDDVDKLLDQYAPPIQPSWQDASADPNRAQFGGKAQDGGWELTATSSRDADRPGVVLVKARVAKTSDKAPEHQTVRFHLSPDFRVSKADVNVVDGAAELHFPTHYPFVLGLELFNPDGPKLELDLEDVFKDHDDD